MTKHSGPVVAQRGDLTVINCQACQWAHLDPLPDAAALDRYYASEFWQTTKAGWREQYDAQREWLAMRHGDWLAALEPHTDGRTLLDVGCGWGHFLEAARARAWRTWGIEPSTEASGYAWEHAGVNANLYGGTWEQFDVMRAVSDPTHFDALTAFWLLEHLPDPVAFLRWAADHLAPGGALMLAVPQEWTRLQGQANEVAAVKNYWLDATHAHYWTRATLTALLARCGFQVVDALATFPVEWWVLAGDDYTADAAVGAEWHAKLRASQLAQPQYERLELARAWAEQGLGRDLIVVAKRVEDAL